MRNPNDSILICNQAVIAAVDAGIRNSSTLNIRGAIGPQVIVPLGTLATGPVTDFGGQWNMGSAQDTELRGVFDGLIQGGQLLVDLVSSESRETVLSERGLVVVDEWPTIPPPGR